MTARLTRAVLALGAGIATVVGTAAPALATAPAVSARPALSPPALLAAPAQSSVTLPATAGKNVVTYSSTAPFNNGQANLVRDDVTGACTPSNAMGAMFRDTHIVDVAVPTPPSSALDVLIRFQIDWTPPATSATEPAEDLRMDLYGPDGKLVASSDGSQTSEGIDVTSATPGTYQMVVCAFQTGPNGQAFTGTISASVLNPPPFTASAAPAATYAQYTAPLGLATGSGEPSIGNNWKTGATLFTSNTKEYKVAFDDVAGTSTWTPTNNAAPNGSNTTSLDPIGFTDSPTGRSFISQLVFACSGAVYSDDDFATSIPSQGCGSGINGFDHQTIGGGPYPPTVLANNPGFTRAYYYCSQAQALVAGGAVCSRSDDGGLTFANPNEIFGGKCNGIHGHVRVSPKDGTVYVPDNNCGGLSGVSVSTDGGLTWTVRTVPDSNAGTSDASVSAGADGTVYFGYSDGTGRAKIAVSRDKGVTWSPSTDAGGAFGIRNAEFAEVIAGDGDRAAFAFLGTTTPGSTQAASFGKDAAGTTFTGAAWHMYVATTIDRGASWSTVDATPNDPVQRGCIWNAGGSNPCRNLLDFNDITLDKTGRVMIGFADGCVPATVVAGNNCASSALVSDNKLVKQGAIVRQLSGPRLFAAADAPTPALPEARSVALLPVLGLAAAVGVVLLRRRRRTA